MKNPEPEKLPAVPPLSDKARAKARANYESALTDPLAQQLLANMNRNVLASSQASEQAGTAPPKKHFMEEMAQAMVDNLNANVLAEQHRPRTADTLRVVHEQRRLAGIKPGVSWKAPTLPPEEWAAMLAEVKAREAKEK